MTIIRTILITALLMGAPTLVAMKPQVTIVDQNEGQELPTEVPEDTQVSIFGSTPRYESFRHCMDLLGKQLKELDQAYAKNKRLKGVQKPIKQLMMRFKQAHPEGSLSKRFEELSFDDKCALFFKIGLDTTLHKENMAALCQCAQANHTQNPAERYQLIHMLLPIYFDDCALYKPSSDTIYAFLKAITRFYKAQYEEIDQAPEILMYIPPLKYFTQILEASLDGEVDKASKDKLAHELLLTEIFSQIGSSKPVVLINPSARGLKALAANLTHSGIPPKRMKLIELVLEGKCLQRTKSFSPYLLKRQENRTSKLDYRTSPFITEALLTALLNGSKGEK